MLKLIQKSLFELSIQLRSFSQKKQKSLERNHVLRVGDGEIIRHMKWRSVLEGTREYLDERENRT